MQWHAPSPSMCSPTAKHSRHGPKHGALKTITKQVRPIMSFSRTTRLIRVGPPVPTPQHVAANHKSYSMTLSGRRTIRGVPGYLISKLRFLGVGKTP